MNAKSIQTWNDKDESQMKFKQLISDDSKINKYDNMMSFCSSIEDNDKFIYQNIVICFSDLIWDFSSASIITKDKCSYVFKFQENNVNNKMLKFYLLFQMYTKRIKFTSLTRKHNDISRIVYSHGFYDVEKNVINSEVIYGFLKKSNLSINTENSYKSKILDYLNFISVYFGVKVSQNLIKHLSAIDKIQGNLIKESNKRPVIPIHLLNGIVNTCLKLMNSDDICVEDRITAAAVVLISQCGFRCSEFLGLRVDLIDSRTIYDNTNVFYVTFETTKGTRGETNKSNRSILNDHSYAAFLILRDLCESFRSRLNTNVLFVSPQQKNKAMISTHFGQRLKIFYAKYGLRMGLINVNNEYPELRTAVLKDIANHIYSKMDGLRNSVSENKNLHEDDLLTYPLIMDYRVTVCNHLAKKGVPLHYIQTHMGHLSIEMTTYYLRPSNSLDHEFSLNVYKEVIGEKVKILGKNADQFTDKINEYIEENRFNIYDNLNNVVEKISLKFPLRQKSTGICIKCGDIVPCGLDKITDELYCAFEMCPNHCHLFYYAGETYSLYLEKVAVFKKCLDDGYFRASDNERLKLQYFVKNTFIPQLIELEKEIAEKGKAIVLENYSSLYAVIENYQDIKLEVEKWLD